MVDATVSIVNWNTRDELRDCLNSILSQRESVKMEVYVVDNASCDGSADMVASEFAGDVVLITNSDNKGFGTAHNQAISRCSGRYVLILNPDCRILHADLLRKMVDYMDANRDIGMMGPRILNPDGSLQFSARRFPPMFAGLFRHTILGKLFPNNRFVKGYLMTDMPHDQIMDVDWLSGSALMVRRETFEQIGLLDERFFMYCEDVDWCKRAHDAGWRIVYYPKVEISHRIGAASDKNPIAMIKAHHRSMFLYFVKHNAKSPKILLAPLVVVALWLRTWARARLVKLD
ncbi:MAG: glycosyltransferase family 2 protein [Armatimonadetes bacterium]|nr:glycosyltransferase family 2 protein [Armatimonadota bacterium]